MLQTYILVLENSENDLNLLIRCIETALNNLQKQQFIVKGFIQPKEALKFMKQNKCPVLFTNAELCGTDGFDIARKVQIQNPNCNIIFVTAYEEYILEALQTHLHLSGYLMKPPTVESVKDQLENLRF